MSTIRRYQSRPPSQSGVMQKADGGRFGPGPLNEDRRITVMMIIEDVRSQVTPMDKTLLSEARRNIVTSDLPIDMRKKLLAYIKPAEEGRLARWVLVRTVSVVREFLRGAGSDERLDFEQRYQKATMEEGGIEKFLEGERAAIMKMPLPESEKTTVGEFFRLYDDSSEEVRLVAANALRVFHPADSPDREERMRNWVNILTSDQRMSA